MKRDRRRMTPARRRAYLREYHRRLRLLSPRSLGHLGRRLIRLARELRKM